MVSSGGLAPVEALALIEAHGVGTWTWNLADGSLSWSRGIWDMFALDPQSATPSIGLYESMIHPDDRIDFANPARLAASGVIAQREFRIIRPDGEMRWLRSFGKLIHSRDGRPDRMVGVAFDVTEASGAYRALQQQDGLTGALRELFDVVIWRTEADGRVSDSLEWLRATGQQGRVDDWNRLESVHPDDRQRVRDAWDAAIRSGHRYAAACRVLHGGEYVPVVSRGIAIRDAHGAIESWVGFTARQGAAGTSGLGEENSEALTAGQVRAARGFLGWSAEQLAEQAGVSFSTVRRVETPGERGVRNQSLAAIRAALERAGIGFVTGAGGEVGVTLK